MQEGVPSGLHRSAARIVLFRTSAATGRFFTGSSAPDCAVTKMNAALGKFCDVGLVGDHHHRQPIVIQLLKHFENFDGSPAIQISGGFVGQQDGRVIDQSARNRNPLLLASGKLGREVLHAVSQVPPVQGLRGPAFVLLLC